MTDQPQATTGPESASCGQNDPKRHPYSPSDIAIEIAENEAKLGAYRKKSRAMLALVGAVISIASVGTLMGDRLLPENTSFVKFLPLAGYSTVAYFALAAVYLLAMRASRNASLEAEIETLKAKQRILSRLPEEEPVEKDGSYFDQLVRINVENLAAYYAQVKAQADKSFIAAVAVGGIGFLFIIGSLVIGLFGMTTSVTLSFISAASGIITEFIAAIFFYLYSKTVRQMKEYHDSLLAVQNVLLSFKLVGDIQKEETKASMIGQMLQYLIGSRETKLTSANNSVEDTGASRAASSR